MISLKLISETESCIDDLVDSSKDNIHYAKNSIKAIKRTLSKLDNDADKVSLENDLIEYEKFIELHSKILDLLYQSNPGHDAIIGICDCIINAELNKFYYNYGLGVLSSLVNNNRHGISELYFRDELYLSSLVSILNYSLSDIMNIDSKNCSNTYNINKVVNIIKKNHNIDDIDMDKATYVVDIYNIIDTMILWFNDKNNNINQ
jgi:hypothetical protein